MNTGDALLADIRANPDDVGLRRIYADWLEDHGDSARAEFIRVQLDLAALDEWDEARPALMQREQELLAAHRDLWLAGLPTTQGVFFEAGFPERWWLDGPRFIAYGPRIAAHTPIVCLSLTQLREDAVAQAVGQFSLLDTVRYLSLESSQLSEWNLIKWLQYRSFSELCGLSLSLLLLNGAALSALLRHPASLRLEHLDLSFSGLYGTDLENLAQAPTLGRLRSLKLDGNHLGNLEMDFLAAASHWSELEELRLRSGEMSVAGLRSLARAPFLSRLRRLDLSFNPLGGECEPFFRQAPLDCLTDLELSGLQLNWEGVQALVRSGCWGQLQVLDLSNNQLNRRDLQTLAEATHVPPLRQLRLNRIGLGREEARTLATWPGLRMLRVLHLEGNSLDAHALRALLFSPHWGPIRQLNLSRNPVGYLGAQVLARWPGLANLSSLWLDSCELDDAAALVLLEALPPGRELRLGDNPFSANIQEAFQARGHRLW
ncbi:MAG: TIGR02996 domain-containing protein [Gemmataceae bacterium]